ncbi:uncharacterized protein LOC110922453 isoform X2 [Helianthus annuus]|uniref:uncharacterized protein LOC110922453 isoform X2 n=1 Tax=Helianthus annuus TaxID=4232 RepID=UPI001652EAEC|nr:uncharacterized protein LOC110922453 isoform X2 [Helianthus annuus]
MIMYISIPICPESFRCAALPPFMYPFYNATDTSCGLIKMSASCEDCHRRFGQCDTNNGYFQCIHAVEGNRTIKLILGNIHLRSPLCFTHAHDTKSDFGLRYIIWLWEIKIYVVYKSTN